MSPKPPSHIDSVGNQAWHVERYVLADPTLDRQAFEAAMAEDVNLALAVAQCVAQMQGLAQACRERNALAVTRRSSHSPRRWLSHKANRLVLAVATLAAAWLVALGGWQELRPARDLPGFSQPSSAGGAEQQLAEVAQQWFNLDAVTADDSSGWLPSQTGLRPTSLAADLTSGPDVELAEFEAHPPAALPEEHDWMLQVSAAFFEESES